ncbi:MAG: archaeal heat shock protein Hsp20 [Candidatus Caldarchaeum sp.]|nr:Hsp20/alpha crystallin family protein [Candidatus Caldarchaeum sp.]MDW8062601.1 archaeal heat shock protein Hsp20 [Candidatus Caldarchaeum sp.]MDW8435630.1 archaeal heat shock protein Hsp20 [Candidatus Caldarchaeum sp.]
MSDDWWFSRRRRRPFSFFEEFEAMFEEMQKEFMEEVKRIMDSLPKELVKETRTPTGVRRQYGPFIYGYSITIGPDGKPVFRQFGNVSPAALPRGVEVRPEREPLVDVFEDEKTVKVVAEIPGVKKEDIDLTVDANRLTVKVDTEERKYYKEVELPAEVLTSGVKAVYNNGVLEVVLPKKEAGKTKGEKIKVE